MNATNDTDLRLFYTVNLHSLLKSTVKVSYSVINHLDDLEFNTLNGICKHYVKRRVKETLNEKTGISQADTDVVIRNSRKVIDTQPVTPYFYFYTDSKNLSRGQQDTKNRKDCYVQYKSVKKRSAKHFERSQQCAWF